MELEANYKNINISQFDYPLTNERIAKHPLAQRDLSKLLVYNDKSISKSTFSSVSDYINSDDLLIFNNTKVVQARLLFKKSTGSTIEIFLLNPILPNEYQLAFGATSETHWNCIVGNIKRWKGEILELPIPSIGISLRAEMIDRTDDGALIKFTWDQSEINFAQIIEICGQVPIPPYLNREPEEEDKSRYQTVYAKPEGSVAAPTAGLHFTNKILNSLKNKNINFAEVTLHVGAGTFKPVKSETIGEHEMHTERFYVTKSLINNILKTKGKIVVVGTTSMRTLESLYWLGVKVLESKEPFINPIVNQWDGYTLKAVYSTEDSLNALLKHLDETGNDYISASTRMIIVPGYNFKIVDVLITNFHQPRSTLLLLVAAFIGTDWTEVYKYALENNFRFLSYGDSSILFKKN